MPTQEDFFSFGAVLFIINAHAFEKMYVHILGCVVCVWFMQSRTHYPGMYTTYVRARERTHANARTRTHAHARTYARSQTHVHRGALLCERWHTAGDGSKRGAQNPLGRRHRLAVPHPYTCTNHIEQGGFRIHFWPHASMLYIAYYEKILKRWFGAFIHVFRLLLLHLKTKMCSLATTKG